MGVIESQLVKPIELDKAMMTLSPHSPEAIAFKSIQNQEKKERRNKSLAYREERREASSSLSSCDLFNKVHRLKSVP